MLMYDLIEYGDAYSKTSTYFWQRYIDKPALDNNNNIIDFPADKNNTTSFKFKEQITGQNGNNRTKDVEIMVPLLTSK